MSRSMCITCGEYFTMNVMTAIHDNNFCTDECIKRYEELTEEKDEIMKEATTTADKIDRVLEALGGLLKAKNKAYGNSALEPIRVFSKADNLEQINVRLDDKLSRIRNGSTDEDAEWDLMGYLVLKRIAMMSVNDEPDVTKFSGDVIDVMQRNSSFRQSIEEALLSYPVDEQPKQTNMELGLELTDEEECVIGLSDSIYKANVINEALKDMFSDGACG